MDISKFKHFKKSEEALSVIKTRTQGKNDMFFRLMIAYYYGKMASMMRCSIDTKDRGKIPVNIFVINLALSGQNKGYSNSILAEELTAGFRGKFLKKIFPKVAKGNLKKLALQRVKDNKKGEADEDVEYSKLVSEFKDAGELLFSFDSATTAALKQFRSKLILANAGSMCWELDEIASNLSGTAEIISTFLELFDISVLREKLIKHTKESQRSTAVFGRTPANMLLFGTPAKLLDGGKTEDDYFGAIEMGMGRRTFFSYSNTNEASEELTAEELYDIYTDSEAKELAKEVAKHYTKLATMSNFNKELSMSRDNAILLIEYKLWCAARVKEMPEHETMLQAEMEHRNFKVLKLAGAYAFVDRDAEVKREHIEAAILMAEESGEQFGKMVNRERPYVKLANYLAALNRQITQADLVQDLPFYSGSKTHRAELMELAISYGYSHNIVITRHTIDSIETFKGSALEKTDTNKMILSYSTNTAKGYKPTEMKFNKLCKLFNVKGYHWCSHQFKDKYRDEEHVIPKFNMVVLDIDDGTQISSLELLLSEYKYIIYTTKRHKKKKNRFRLVLPLSHVIEMDDPDEYSEFMRNIYDWVPTTVDTSTSQRSRKWLSHNGVYKINEGELLNALQFIPKTRQEEEYKEKSGELANLDQFEKWFIQNTDKGNRSNQLIKYAYALADVGNSVSDIESMVLDLNSKFSYPLKTTEIQSTIMTTIKKKLGA